MRSNAAKAWFALVEGQSEDGFLGRNEGHIHGAGNRFPVLQAVRDQPQREGLHGRCRLLLGSAVRGDARKRRNIRQPAAILFAVVLESQ